MSDHSPERKSLKVSTPVHSAVHDLATRLGKSADEAVRALLDPSTVRLPLSPRQHARWTEYSDAAGIPLEQWVIQRVEAAIQFGTDQGTMADVLAIVRSIAAAGDIPTRRTRPVPPRRPLQPGPSSPQEK